jgi:3-oxoacyl-[acyl-carrier protein] reductase
MIDQTFVGKVAIVTGAGVGIGYEIARQLALRGAQVLLNDVDTELAQRSAQAIVAEGGQVLGVGGDVADVDTVRGFVDRAVSAFGRLDMAVANAGLTTWCDFFEYTPEMFERVTSVNLRGSYFLAQAAARQFRQQASGGRILFMSSVTGHQAIPYVTAYGMTKAALEHLAKNLTVELAPYRITVNCVAPGATVTPRNLADDPDYANSWGGVIPTGSVAYPLDIANAALFLLSPLAEQITGQTLVVDGGWSAISPTPSLDFVEKKP